jgi:AraC family ethanolamine operon transcriptional activator
MLTGRKSNMPKALFEVGLVINTSQQHTEDVPNYTHGWDVDINEMTKQPFEVDIRAIHTFHLQLSLMCYHAAIMIDGGYPDGTVIFSCIKTNGLIHEKNRTYHNDDMIMLNDNKHFDLIVSEACYIFTLAIEKEILEREFESFFNIPFRTVYKEQDIYLDLKQSEAYYSLFKEEMEVLKERSAENTSKEAYEVLEIEILKKLFAYFLFRPKEINYLPRYIRDGRVLLEQNINATYTIADMVEDLQVSKRTIQYGFKHYLGFTPKEYQQYIRLNGIHNTILNVNDPHTTLSEIAARYNYYHLGHFSTEYKKFFGESPSETLRKVQYN